MSDKELPVLWALWTGDDYQRYGDTHDAEGEVITYTHLEQQRREQRRRPVVGKGYRWVCLKPEIVK